MRLGSSSPAILCETEGWESPNPPAPFPTREGGNPSKGGGTVDRGAGVWQGLTQTGEMGEAGHGSGAFPPGGFCAGGIPSLISVDSVS